MIKGNLCYISGCGKAFFTTQPLSEQWGDDWNDAPYEHNAGYPYTFRADYDGKYNNKQPWEINYLYFEGDFETPDAYVTNSPYSVQDINNKAVPWLKGDRYGKLAGKFEIWAGTSAEDFCRAVLEAGGKVFISLTDL
jgi:hypothetical protein